MIIYSGYLKDDEKLLKSASGGAVTALSEYFINNGGCVFGVAYSKDFRNAEYVCVEDLSDLEKLKGSKYIISYKGDIYNTLTEKLKANKYVLYIGLGCDIAGVKAYVKNKGLDDTNLFTIDILCHGPAVDGVHRLFIEELEERYKSKLVDFTVRYKKNEWTPFYIKALFENGREYIEPFNETDYGKAFYNVARPVCTHCKFKGNNHKGDLCCGDYWGLTKKMLGWNDKGVSILIVQSAKGQKLINMLARNFELREEVDYDFILQHNIMYLESRKQKFDYERFIYNLKKSGLHYAVLQIPCEQRNPLGLLKRYIKRLLRL